MMHGQNHIKLLTNTTMMQMDIKYFLPLYMNLRSNEDCSSTCCKYCKTVLNNFIPLRTAGRVGFESIIPYHNSNQNQCLSTREFYRACPSNLTASDAQFTTYKQSRHLQTGISEHTFTNWVDKIGKLSQSMRQSPVQSVISKVWWETLLDEERAK